MKKVFSNSSQVQCTFTDDGITFGGTDQEIFLPYGCIDSIGMSIMGILQATSHVKICSFAVDRKDRAAMKEMIAYAKQAMKTAPKTEPQTIDLNKDAERDITEDLPPEEQLKRYKTLFIQGVISKEEYDARKRQLKNH